MSLSTADLQVMKFGYLNGSDLLQFCAPSLLISQYEKDNNCLQFGCTLAYNRIISKLGTRYNVLHELDQVAPDPANLLTPLDSREPELVRIVTIIAVSNILGSLANISPQLVEMFKMANKDLLQIQNGQSSLFLATPQDNTDLPNSNQSIPILSQDSFLTLG
jgi:hypothetical protein